MGLHALIHPARALEHRQLLIDVAEAGDFATFRDRRAARASMVIDAFADAERSPISDRLVGSYDDKCVVLYEEMIPMLVSIAADDERFRDLWADEDAELTASERAITDGLIEIEEVPDVDLAIVTIPDDEVSHRGHRFAGESFDPVHPMALHNATNCLRLLVVHGRRYQFVDRYESWVQYRSRRPLPRVDLRPLAEQLSNSERESQWNASGPGSLTPTLRVDGESSLEPGLVRRMILGHLHSSAPAWDPYSADSS